MALSIEEIQRRSREVFRTEAAELLRELEQAVLELEHNPRDAAVINRMFRVMHTLKGSGATAGYQRLSDFLHRVEDLYNAARDGRIEVDDGFVDLTLRVGDLVGRHLAAEGDEASAILAGGTDILESCAARLPDKAAESDSERPKAAQGAVRKVKVAFKPHPDLFRRGTDPALFIEELKNLGPSCSVRATAGDLPELAAMDPETCYLKWEFLLETPADDDAIRGAFLFVEGDCDIRPAEAAIAGTPEAQRPEPASGGRSSLQAAAREMLRVPPERLDRLVNLVGELVILRSQVSNVCSTLQSVPSELLAASEALQALSTEMREVVLSVRMMPVELTFGKFRRLVRDLSRELGKEAELSVVGAETEMDKTMLDALADPLMHLVRNALDHGLEPPVERQAAGKPRKGTLSLRAERRGDRVVVSVGDDGRGIDLERIRAKAAARGMIGPDDRPGREELLQMLFLPGFSTADRVSKVSGRGVGLDVVRKQVEALRGKVEIKSELNRGTEFCLSLPLTLAIIEGLMVEVDGDRFILPLAAARETIEVRSAEREAGNGRNWIGLRGERIPYLSLRKAFGFPPSKTDTERIVVVELEDGRRIGLCVDRVLGNHQTVLKSLGWLGRRTPVFSGATVLGDGRIALIIDVANVIESERLRNGPSAGLEI